MNIHSVVTENDVELIVPTNITVGTFLSALVQTDKHGVLIGDTRGEHTLSLIRKSNKQFLADEFTLTRYGIQSNEVLFVAFSRRTLPQGQNILRSVSGDLLVDLDAMGKSVLEVGRSTSTHRPDIDLRNEPYGTQVSRTHALLRKEAGGWFLIPLRTTNSTWIGHKRVLPGQAEFLRDGDVIAFGRVRLRFEAQSDPQTMHLHRKH